MQRSAENVQRTVLKAYTAGAGFAAAFQPDPGPRVTMSFRGNCTFLSCWKWLLARCTARCIPRLHLPSFPLTIALHHVHSAARTLANELGTSLGLELLARLRRVSAHHAAPVRHATAVGEPLLSNYPVLCVPVCMKRGAQDSTSRWGESTVTELSPRPAFRPTRSKNLLSADRYTQFCR